MPCIPERISSKMPPAVQKRISETKLRKVSHASQLSNFSVASSSVSDFLEEKIKAYEYDYDYLAAQISGLQSARAAQILDGDQYGNEAAPFLQQQAKIGQELSLITAQQKIITEDIEEELNTQNELDVRKKRRGNENEPGLDFFERAYAATIIPKIMSATAKHKKRRFDTSEFRGNVLTAYNAVTVKGGAQLAWCHITGGKLGICLASKKPQKIFFMIGD
jgi:hypothetical protein